MNRFWKWAPIIALALTGCTTMQPLNIPQEEVERSTKSKDQAIMLERSVWIIAEQAAAGAFSYEVTNRTKVMTFAALRRRKVAANLPPKSKLVSFEGRTMQPDGTVDKADPDAAHVRGDKLVFELPQPAVGAVLEYKYKIRCKASLQLFYWQFQRGIPVVRSDLTVSWPKTAKLGYRVVNAPSGRITEPEIGSGPDPGDPALARIHWGFFDLTARPPGKDRFTIVVGPKEFLTEENRDSGVGWGAGFGQFDNYLPRTAPPNIGTSKPSPGR
jgi:hypothetical protein